MNTFAVVKIFVLTTVSFLLAFSWNSFLVNFLTKHKLGKQIRDEESAPVFFSLHKGKSGTPTMGGLLVWVTVLILAVAALILHKTFDGFWSQFNFLIRSQTLLPLGALVASALVGLLDDYWNIRKIGPLGGGLRMRHRIIIYTIIAMVGAWWFFYKLDWDLIHIPFLGNYNIGLWYLPLFIFVIVATSFSVNETDGLDGLAGGTLLASFATFGAIAATQGKVELAAFCGVIVGALLAFLWHNIYPARFFMGDTGAMSLGVTLGIVAMLTNSVFLLPIIGFVFVLESSSVIIQVLSKKITGKKVFLSAPIHHHLEAKGWKEPQIVMRFWVISGVAAVVGVILSLLDRS